MGYSPQGRKELDTTVRPHFHFHFRYTQPPLPARSLIEIHNSKVRRRETNSPCPWGAAAQYKGQMDPGPHTGRHQERQGQAPRLR